jgi:hypothetical protein
MKVFLLLFVVVALAACDSTDTIHTAAGVPTAASTTREVVAEADVARQAENTPPTNNWVLFTRTMASTGTFVAGPGTPPAGSSSIEFGTPTSADKVYLYNYDHIGVALSDIESIGYSTHRTVGTGPAVVSINIQVDVNGGALNPGEFATIVYEPYNTFPAPIVNGTWQTWDAFDGGSAKWWGTSAVSPSCPISAPCTWNALLAAYPNATIVGAFGVNQGSGNPGIVSAADLLSLGYDGDVYEYDFERFRVPENREECFDGGWQTLYTADGQPFRNQGQCVSYANHNP